jgi:hypothetical protein
MTATASTFTATMDGAAYSSIKAVSQGPLARLFGSRSSTAELAI